MDSIGSAIRNMRHQRHMTIKELAYECNKYSDDTISATMIGLWETGKRRIYADQLEIICKALECVPTNLMPSFLGRSDTKALDRYHALPEEEREIIKHCAATWKGNSRALVFFMGLYMSLDIFFRKDLAEYGIWKYEEAIKSGHLDKSAPPIPIDYIRHEADNIGK